MDATKVTIPGIFNGSRLLEIPFYQRSYVWGEKEWDRFLSDMKYVTATAKPYFVGSIILKAHVGPVGQAVSEHRVVIDGQQRLTTFILFFKVLCLKMGHNDLFSRDFILEDGRIALQHGRNDLEAFEQAVSSDKLEKLPVDNHAPSQIVSAYNWFIDNLEITEVDRNTVKSCVQFVCIDLGDDEDEQQIFDTINSLGVRLTTAELLKNYLFSRDNVEEYEHSWVSIFEQDDDALAFWDTKVHAGRFEYTLIELFFDALLQIKARDGSYDVSTEHRLAFNRTEQLFSSYKLFIEEYMKGNKHAFLGEMAEYAALFRRLFDPSICDRAIPAEYGIERINVLIFGLENLTLVPYILFVAHKVGSATEFVDICEVLESYIVRRILVRANNRSYGLLFLSFVLNKVLSKELLVEQIKRQFDQAAYFPDNNEINDAFRTSRLTNKVARGILYLLESGIRPVESSTSLLGLNSYSLEHLLPKKWRNKWNDISPDSEEAHNRDRDLLTLGNLAIITQPLNSSIRDSAWKDKLKGSGNKPGLYECAKGLSTMYDVMNWQEWNEESISVRAQSLLKDALKVWAQI